MGFVSMVSTMIYGLRVALFIMDLYKREKILLMNYQYRAKCLCVVCDCYNIPKPR